MNEPMDKLLRIDEIEEIFRVNKSTIYRWMAQGSFPEPIRLSTKCIRWRMSEARSVIDGGFKRIEAANLE